ncbi:MAG: 2Fe-2S iron-sulfur cluster-binding protein [Cyanobacteria bacterium J06639_1]
MAKTVKLEPIATETSVKTNTTLLSVLLENELSVMQECRGRGRCATCHVYIREGEDSLSPIQRREQRTLEVISTCGKSSRLACQTRVLGEGVVVELPSGMYVNAIDDIDSLIGRRAQQDILDPLTGKVLVEEDKLITRSIVRLLADAQAEAGRLLAQTEDA